MAFQMDGIIVDRVSLGVAEDFDGNILYTLTQLSDATIDITSDSKESRDATGTLIKRFYTGKSGTFTANNALIDFNILAEGAGSPKQVASSAAKITMPGVMTVATGTTTVTLKGAVEDTVRVVGIASNGTLVKTYTKDTASAEGTFSISGEVLSLPTDASVANFVVKYDRAVESGIKIANRADEFPKAIKLTLKALVVDSCDSNTLRSCFIVLPNFQVSPDVSLSLATDTQLQYSGDLQLNYCGKDGKVLYEIYYAEDDVE